MPAKNKTENEIFTYKDKPLLRCGNKIYYGNVEDKYIVRFTIDNGEELKDLHIANRVTIDLMTNEGEERSKIIKQAERDGLYKALDIGCFWLQDALEHF